MDSQPIYTDTGVACPDREEICDNGVDDNCDGRMDCLDSACAELASCQEDCRSGEDEDLDGLVDCADPECEGLAHCIEDCFSGADEDLDGLVDCADPECVGLAHCIEDCFSGADEDLDGLVDCADPECEGLTPCIEDCSSGADEDLDGLVDCEDADCVEEPHCQEDCETGGDEDLDGLENCEDDDCWHLCTTLILHAETSGSAWSRYNWTARRYYGGIEGVYGTLHWRDGSVSSSCDWTLSGSGWISSAPFGDLQDVAFQVSDSCAFVPEQWVRFPVLYGGRGVYLMWDGSPVVRSSPAGLLGLSMISSSTYMESSSSIRYRRDQVVAGRTTTAVWDPE